MIINLVPLFGGNHIFRDWPVQEIRSVTVFTLSPLVFTTKSCNVLILSLHNFTSSTFFFRRPLILPVIKPRPSSSRLSSSSDKSLTLRKLADIVPSELVVRHSLVSPESNLSATIDRKRDMVCF